MDKAWVWSELLCALLVLPRLSRSYSSNCQIAFFRQASPGVSQSRIVICAASSAAGNPQSDADFNPHEVLGVNPIKGFDKVKQTYGIKLKDAQRSGDETTAALLEKAYDKLMYSQLMDRKKGVTFGSFKVSKDIKYADKQPMIHL